MTFLAPVIAKYMGWKRSLIQQNLIIANNHIMPFPLALCYIKVPLYLPKAWVHGTNRGMSVWLLSIMTKTKYRHYFYLLHFCQRNFFSLLFSSCYLVLSNYYPVGSIRGLAKQCSQLVPLSILMVTNVCHAFI